VSLSTEVFFFFKQDVSLFETYVKPVVMNTRW